MTQNDVIVIGAGHNGLVFATSLARAGRKVLVLEQRETVGGLCAPRVFHTDGDATYTAPGVLNDTSEVRPGVIDSLGLHAHGLKMGGPDEPIFAPQQDGPGLLLHKDAAKAQAEIAKHSEKDVAGYQRYRAFLDKVGPVIRDATNRAPPPLRPAATGEVVDMGMRGLALRRLGGVDMMQLIRCMPMAVADFMREHFETELLSALLAGPAIVGSFSGVWSPGTATNLILHEANAAASVVGGPAALVSALEKALKSHGGTVRTSAEVQRVLVTEGRVSGVMLVSGEEIKADIVASSCDPKNTLLEFLAPGHLPFEVEEQARVFRARGTTAKVHLALSAPLSFSSREGEVFERVRIGETLDDLERAFDAVKYRRFSDAPHLDISMPTVSDPSLAPAGHHVASILVDFAPLELEIGWSQDSKEALLETVLDTVAKVAPGVRDVVVGSEVLSPLDLHEEYGLWGGQIHHGEHALDQLLMMRPGPSLRGYLTPLPGLVLCGSGSHPGGGVTCAPGALAAKAVL